MLDHLRPGRRGFSISIEMPSYCNQCVTELKEITEIEAETQWIYVQWEIYAQ
jgi:hypothetical protein